MYFLCYTRNNRLKRGSNRSSNVKQISSKSPKTSVYIIESIVIYYYTMLVSVMKLPQLAYCNCIYGGLLLHPFMVVILSLKWTKLHSYYHLFVTLRIPSLGKLCRQKVMNFWTSDKIFHNEFFKKVNL